MQKKGSLKKLSAKFKLKYNETIKSLQFNKAVRQHYENAEEWMADLEWQP